MKAVPAPNAGASRGGSSERCGITNMKTNTKIVICVAVIILVLIIYFSAVIPAILLNVPQNVYAAYLGEKYLTCPLLDLENPLELFASCGSQVNKCSDTNGETVYILDRGDSGSFTESYYDENGELLCSVKLTLDSGGSSEYPGCPIVRTCSARFG